MLDQSQQAVDLDTSLTANADDLRVKWQNSTSGVQHELITLDETNYGVILAVCDRRFSAEEWNIAVGNAAYVLQITGIQAFFERTIDNIPAGKEPRLYVSSHLIGDDSNTQRFDPQNLNHYVVIVVSSDTEITQEVVANAQAAANGAIERTLELTLLDGITSAQVADKVQTVEDELEGTTVTIPARLALTAHLRYDNPVESIVE